VDIFIFPAVCVDTISGVRYVSRQLETSVLFPGAHFRRPIRRSVQSQRKGCLGATRLP